MLVLRHRHARVPFPPPRLVPAPRFSRAYTLAHTAHSTDDHHAVPPPKPDGALVYNTHANAPVTTLPAPLNLPEIPPGGRNFTYFKDLGKNYLAFFKTGLKNVWNNQKEASKVEKWLDRHSAKKNWTLTDAVMAYPNIEFSRGCYLLMLRSKHDIMRVPIFALIFLVCGEFSPLIFPFIPSAVPYTCRIPQQQTRERTMIEARRKESFRTRKTLIPTDSAASNEVKRKAFKELSREELLHCSDVLGLHSRCWKPPNFLLRHRLAARIRHLALDNVLIDRYGVSAIDPGEELVMAAVERGIDVMGVDERVIRENLTKFVAEQRNGIRPGLWLIPYAHLKNHEKN